MKQLLSLAFLIASVFQMSSCDVIRGAINNPQNTTYRCVPMTQGEFGPAHSRVTAETFDKDKMRVAKQVTTNGGCLTAQQISMVTSAFTFENDKLDYAKFAYPYCADPKNYSILNSQFTFDSSKRELGKITGVN
jgi:Domain of unknown function (DUF4476)